MNKSDQDDTGVDLGDDLLRTRTLQRPAPSKDESVEESIDELLLNAKILMGEGLLEDAKRTLRKVMKRSPGNLSARDRFEEIRKIEIKKLLGDEESPRASFRRAKRNAIPDDGDAAEAMAALEKECGSPTDAEDEFFRTKEERSEFLRGLEGLCRGASAQDRIDLGIGFMEMGFHEVAIRQFEAALKDSDHERKARGLLATALLEKGRTFDAIIELEMLIAHQDAQPDEKIDYGYMAGKAQEALGHYPAALQWYRAVHQLDPQYRDVVERIKFCLKKCGNTRSSSSSPSSRS